MQRGRSPFAGRLGDAVASAALTVTDHATDPAGLNSSPFDAEGAPRGQTPLIEAGKLAAYLHDSYTARREQAAGAAGARTTANASRAGYRSPPSVSTSNLVVAPGAKSFEELLAEAGDGVYVTDVAGLHSGVNPVSGTFSVGATGRLIEGGQLAAPADEFTIASDLQSMLKAITAAASESALGPLRRLGQRPGAADRGDGGGRVLGEPVAAARRLQAPWRVRLGVASFVVAQILRP